MRLITTLFLLLMSQTLNAIEEPAYKLLDVQDKFELREYEAKIIAHVTVSGSMKKASNTGFRLVADYIFGNNTAKVINDDEGGKQKINMTAPVIVQPAPEKIAMTSPVAIEAIAEQWRVSFVMPSEYTMETLPVPNNSKVSLSQIPATKYAVLRFSGLVSEKKLVRKTQELTMWLENKGIKTKGKPELARYNPPWVLPFLRRNEIMIMY